MGKCIVGFTLEAKRCSSCNGKLDCPECKEEPEDGPLCADCNPDHCGVCGDHHDPPHFGEDEQG